MSNSRVTGLPSLSQAAISSNCLRRRVTEGRVGSLSQEIRCSAAGQQQLARRGVDDAGRLGVFQLLAERAAERPRSGPLGRLAWPGAAAASTQAPASVPFALASSSSFWSLGASTALPRTAPLVPADHAMVTNSSACGSGSTTRPNHGPRLNPTGNSPHCSSRAFSIPNDGEPVAHPLAGVGQVVRAGQPRADPVAEHVEVLHHLGVLGPAETIRWTSGLLAFAPSFSAAPASDGADSPIATTHPTQKRRLMRNLLVGKSSRTRQELVDRPCRDQPSVDKTPLFSKTEVPSSLSSFRRPILPLSLIRFWRAPEPKAWTGGFSELPSQFSLTHSGWIAGQISDRRTYVQRFFRCSSGRFRRMNPRLIGRVRSSLIVAEATVIGAIDSQIPAEWPQVRKQITPGNFVSHLSRRTAMHPCGSDSGVLVVIALLRLEFGVEPRYRAANAMALFGLLITSILFTLGAWSRRVRKLCVPVSSKLTIPLMPKVVVQGRTFYYEEMGSRAIRSCS